MNYVIPVPRQPGRWMIVAFSTLGRGDPDGQRARLLVGLFDVIMSTFSLAGGPVTAAAAASLPRLQR